MLVAVRMLATGPVKGPPLERRIFHMLRTADGRLQRAWNFLDRGEALQAMGLPPDTVGTPAGDAQRRSPARGVE